MYDKDTVEVNALVMEFVDTPERIAEISDFIGKGLSIDYSDTNPVLKVDGMLIHEHEYIGKMKDSGELFMCS